VENQRWQRRMRKEEVSGEEAELEKVMVAVVIWTKVEEAPLLLPLDFSLSSLLSLQ